MLNLCFIPKFDGSFDTFGKGSKHLTRAAFWFGQTARLLIASTRKQALFTTH